MIENSWHGRAVGEIAIHVSGSFLPLLRQRESYRDHMQRRFIFPSKERVESLRIVSLAKNVSKTIAFLEHLCSQSLNELRKQFRTYALHISTAESVDDACKELSFFLGELREIYHPPSGSHLLPT